MYSTPFELLVAVVLSAQATDKGVNAATRVLFKIANTPRAIVKLGEERLVRLHPFDWPLSRQGAQRDRGCRRLLLEQHGGEVPRDREALRRCRASDARRRTWC